VGKIRDDEMGGACNTNGRVEKFTRNFGLRAEEKMSL
jgi:hypothetical protein